MKWIELSFAFVILFMNIQFSFAQSEPKPYWVNSLPSPPNGTNTFYAWGVGEGNNKNEARINAELWAVATAIGREMGHEVPRTTLDSLRFSSEFRARIEAQTSKFRKEQRAETELIKMRDGKVQIYVLFEFAVDLGKNIKFGTENHYDAECDKEIKRYNKSLKPKNKNWHPIGLEQFKSKRTFDKFRGGAYLSTQVAGFIGGLVCYPKWQNKKGEYNKLRSQYNNEQYNAKRDEIEKSLAAMEKNKNDYRRGFWLSLGVMLGSYGLNVLDNCLWTKSKQSLNITPTLTTEYNGISLIYNF